VTAALYPQEVSWYSFLFEVESTPGPSAAGRIRSIKKSNDVNGTRTRDYVMKAYGGDRSASHPGRFTPGD
jgi:hypothetical protein